MFQHSRRPCAVFAVLVIAAAMAARGQQVPGYADVIGEYLEIFGARSADTPAPLNRVRYLRLRHRALSEEDDVDAVLIAQPGFSSTPGAWLQLGSQLVTKAHQQACPVEGAADRRCSLEVWVIDRRGSNLEDTEGIRRALLGREPRRALDYYFGANVFTERGTVRRPADGNYDTLLSGPGSRFRALSQDDVPFMWDWGFETAASDLDALIELLPKKARGANVFVAGHSQGGGFVTAWAGRRGLGGKRGYEQVAGLVFLDGGPSIGDREAATDRPINEHLDAVRAMREGRAPRFGAELSGIPLGVGLAVSSAVMGTYFVLQPEREAVFAAPVQPALQAAECFVFGYHLPRPQCLGVGLRLTNRALAGFAFDDDPVPGAMLQTPIIVALGSRLGHLDFTPVEGTEGDCAAAGPDGMKPPCPPSNRQIDPDRVYDWLDGGGGGAAGDDGPTNGWTSFDGGATFSDRYRKSGPNPSRVDAYIQQVGYAPELTNVQAVELRLADGNDVSIDSRVMNGMTWYQSRRYDLDLQFLGPYQTVRLNREGVRYDIDKTAVAAPVYVAARESRDNPFAAVQDYTAIGPGGVQQSNQAKRVSPFDPGVNSALYGHSDFLSADDSLAGRVKPGQPGASLVADTLVNWLLARSDGTVRPPTSKRLGVASWR